MIGENYLLEANFQPVPVGVRVVPRGGLGRREGQPVPLPVRVESLLLADSFHRSFGNPFRTRTVVGICWLRRLRAVLKVFSPETLPTQTLGVRTQAYSVTID